MQIIRKKKQTEPSNRLVYFSKATIGTLLRIADCVKTTAISEPTAFQKLNLPSYYQNATEDSAKIDAAVLKMGEVESTFDELRTNPAQAGG